MAGAQALFAESAHTHSTSGIPISAMLSVPCNPIICQSCLCLCSSSTLLAVCPLLQRPSYSYPTPYSTSAFAVQPDSAPVAPQHFAHMCHALAFTCGCALSRVYAPALMALPARRSTSYSTRPGAYSKHARQAQQQSLQSLLCMCIRPVQTKTFK